jgi:uncharacterized protein YdeI (YjbR/CyaY-like superfamily)
MMTKPSDIEDLLEKKEWHEERKALRSLALGFGLAESVKWGKLCYSHEGSKLAIIYGMKNYCALGFFKGALLDDPENSLMAPGQHSQAMRQLRFSSLNEIKDKQAVIRHFIRSAILAEKAGLAVTFSEKDNLIYPDELQSALDHDAEFASAFDALTPGRRRGYILHFSSATQTRTRAARIEKSKRKILAGKGSNER